MSTPIVRRHKTMNCKHILIPGELHCLACDHQIYYPYGEPPVATKQPRQGGISGLLASAAWRLANAAKSILPGLWLVMFLLLCGCAGLRPQTAATEAAWQALNVVDAGQTVTIGRQPSTYRETWAPDTLGREPQSARVYAVMGAYAIAHFAITSLLDDKDPGYGSWHVLSLVWQSVTLVSKGYNVGHNYSVGLRPWGAHEATTTYAQTTPRCVMIMNGAAC